MKGKHANGPNINQTVSQQKKDQTALSSSEALVNICQVF